MNIDDLSHNSFEEQWQNAFDDASMTPPDAVWEKIELGLGNNVPPKSGNGPYYLGVISVVILGLSLWFFMGNKVGEKPTQIIDNKPIVIEKKVKVVLPKIEEKITIKLNEPVTVNKVSIPEIEENVESPILDIQPEKLERKLADSVDFITPIAPKQIKSDFTTVIPEFQTEQTPYYEKPKPKPKKKSIFRNVRVSGGIGVYQ
jgi:hypothetical protein